MSSDSDSDDYGDTEFITSTIKDTTAALKVGKKSLGGHPIDNKLVCLVWGNLKPKLSDFSSRNSSQKFLLNWAPEADAAHGDADTLRARGGRRQVRLEEGQQRRREGDKHDTEEKG